MCSLMVNMWSLFSFSFFFPSSTLELSMLWLPPTLLVKQHIREFQMIREALFESSQGWPLVQSILEACIHIQVQYVKGTHQLCIVYTWEFHVKGWQCWCDKRHRLFSCTNSVQCISSYTRHIALWAVQTFLCPESQHFKILSKCLVLPQPLFNTIQNP